MSSLIYRNSNSHPFPVHHSKRSSLPHPFEEILTIQLRALLPIPRSGPSVPLSWLSRFAHLLASTLSAAGALFSDDSPSAGAADDDDALAAHLDAGVNLLDACNAISAEIARLRSALLPLHLALRLLSSSSSSEEHDEASRRRRRIPRARAAIADCEAWHDIRHSVGDFVRRKTPVALPRPRASTVRKAAYAVEAVSKLAMEAVVAVLAGARGNEIQRIEVSGECPWAEAFNEVQAAVFDRLSEEFAGEADALDAAVGDLKAAMDAALEEGVEAEELGSALAESERMTEELGHLADGVNAVFNVAINTRDVALNRLRRRLLWRD